jgi:hypothetical protein
MLTNAVAILKEALPEYEKKIHIFDREFCKLMKDHKYFEKLIEDPWDTYRDLSKVHADNYCKTNNFNLSNTLVVDSDPRKVQLCLANSITSEKYDKQDVVGQEIHVNGETKVIDDAWQEKHMSQLADFIIGLLDQADNVPDYLKKHEEFRPPKLL